MRLMRRQQAFVLSPTRSPVSCTDVVASACTMLSICRSIRSSSTLVLLQGEALIITRQLTHRLILCAHPENVRGFSLRACLEESVMQFTAG
jgi:hypothetical protein